MSRHLALAFCLLFLLCPQLRAADSDSKRLERLERAVQLLQQRNTELEKEINSLKADKKSSSPATAAAPAPVPATPEGKAVAEKTESKEVKKPVSVVAGGSLNQEVGVKFGANGLSSRDDAGNTISSVLRENRDGSLAAFNLSSAAERTAYGFDASVRFGPFDFVGEYLSERVGMRTVNGVAPLFTGFRADGYYLQGSYLSFRRSFNS